jgi:thioredoxin-like negative regulator of GroEL
MERQRAAEEAKVHEQLERIGEPFRAGDYPEALKRATDAVNADADNAILGFAYTQSLFANGNYDRAADALRHALQNVDMKTQGVLFGADFYPDAEVFKGKIEQLTVAAGAEPDDNDLQLLLGYQLIAARRYDAAAEALEKTRRDYVNRHAAGLLVNVLDQLQRSEKEADE